MDIPMATRSSSRTRRQADENPELDGSEADNTLPPITSIFDPLCSDSEAPSTSQSQPSDEQSKSKGSKILKKPRKGKKLLERITEKEDAEEDWETTASGFETDSEAPSFQSQPSTKQTKSKTAKFLKKPRTGKKPLKRITEKDGAEADWESTASGFKADSEVPLPSQSQPIAKQTKSKAAKVLSQPRKAAFHATLPSGITEKDDAEKDCESTASVMSERSVLAPIDFNVHRPSRKTRAQKGNVVRLTQSEDDGDTAADAEMENRDQPKTKNPKKGNVSKIKEKESEAIESKTARKTRSKETAEKSNVEHSGISSRLRRKQEPMAQKENSPLVQRGRKPVGTQVNARMLPRASKKTTKKQAKNAGTGLEDSSTSSNFPRSSSPLQLISPIPTDSGTTGPMPPLIAHVDDTLEEIPSISSDHPPTPRKSGQSLPARQSISIDIESASSSTSGENFRENRNVEPVVSISEPVSSSSSNQQPKREDLVINLQSDHPLSIKFSGAILKSGGEITIENESKPKTSNLDKTMREPSKLSFRKLAKLGGRSRRLTSWSDSELADSSDSETPNSESASESDSESGSESDSETGSESETSTSSYDSCSIPHSKKMCRKCDECDYCCVCRR